MSQIFEALRRSREPSRSPAAPRQSAHADAVLATLGFASERPQRNRAWRQPLILVVLLAILASIGWRWYSGAETHPIAPAASTPANTASAPAERIAAPVPSARVPDAPPAAERPIESPRPASLAAATTSSRAKAATPTSDDPFQLALYYHRSGDFENALLRYRAVLEKNELNPRAHNNLGLLYRDKGLLDEAAREFQRALLIDGRYLTARNNLGVVLLGQGKPEEAAAEFRQVLSAEPRNVDAMVNLALAEKAAGKPGAAMETLVRATNIDPRSAAAHYNLAVLYEQSGETGRAVEHYRTFLDHAGSQHAARAPEVRARLAELDRRAAR